MLLSSRNMLHHRIGNIMAIWFTSSIKWFLKAGKVMYRNPCEFNGFLEILVEYIMSLPGATKEFTLAVIRNLRHWSDIPQVPGERLNHFKMRDDPFTISVSLSLSILWYSLTSYSSFFETGSISVTVLYYRSDLWPQLLTWIHTHIFRHIASTIKERRKSFRLRCLWRIPEIMHRVLGRLRFGSPTSP